MKAAGGWFWRVWGVLGMGWVGVAIFLFGPPYGLRPVLYFGVVAEDGHCDLFPVLNNLVRPDLHGFQVSLLGNLFSPIKVKNGFLPLRPCLEISSLVQLGNRVLLVWSVMSG